MLACCAITVWLVTAGMPRTRILLFAAMLLAVLVPLPRFTAFDIVIATFGTLSISTVLHCILVAMSRSGFVMPKASDQEFVSGMSLMILAASALYVSSFGFSTFDLYRLGFDERAFALIAAPIWLWAVWKRWMWFVVTIAVLAVAIRLQVLPSANWWDYVVDPVYWVVAMGKLLIHAWQQRSTAGELS